MGNIPAGLCRQGSLYFNTFFSYSGDLKLKESRDLNENANPYVKEVPGQRSSGGSFPKVKTGDTEMGHSASKFRDSGIAKPAN